MDPFSTVAGVLALLDAVCKSSKFIHVFFRGIVDGPSIVHGHCVLLEVLQNKFLQLQEICALAEPQDNHVLRLSTNLSLCLKDLNIAESRIATVNCNMKSGKSRRTRAIVRWAVFKGDPWVDLFFDRVKIWQSTFTCDLIQLQMRMNAHLKVHVLNSERILQEICPVIVRLNDHLQQPPPTNPALPAIAPPNRVTMLPASSLAKFLQTTVEPTAISGRLFRRFDLLVLSFFFRGGYLVVRNWTPQGQPVYRVSSLSSGYGIEISIKMFHSTQFKFSMMILLPVKSSDRWTLSLKSPMTWSRIVRRTEEAVVATATGNRDQLEKLFTQKRAWPSDTLTNGYSLLHIAASKDQASIVQLLLDEGADPDATTCTGETPLHLALKAKVSLTLAQTLLSHGADIECLDTRKRTPLHTFFNPLISQLVSQCTSSMSTMTADASGMSLAHYFSWTNTSSPADLQVLSNASTLLKARDAAGRTPLHFAAQRGNIPVMEYLLSQYDDPARMQPDREGNTPLHEAVQSSRAPAAIELLLAHGFLLEQRNKEGHTAAQHAVLWGTVDAVKTLLERDPGGSTAWRGRDGKGMLALARRTENLDVEAWLLGRAYGEDETREQEVAMLGDTGRILVDIGVWTTVEAMVILSTTIMVVLALLLDGFLPYLYEGS